MKRTHTGEANRAWSSVCPIGTDELRHRYENGESIREIAKSIGEGHGVVRNQIAEALHAVVVTYTDAAWKRK